MFKNMSEGDPGFEVMEGQHDFNCIEVLEGIIQMFRYMHLCEILEMHNINS